MITPYGNVNPYNVVKTVPFLPPMNGNGKFIPPMKMVMTGEMVNVALFYPHYPKLSNYGQLSTIQHDGLFSPDFWCDRYWTYPEIPIWPDLYCMWLCVICEDDGEYIMIRWYISNFWLVVWNMCYFFHMLERIIRTDFHMFQRGRYTTNQISLSGLVGLG